MSGMYHIVRIVREGGATGLEENVTALRASGASSPNRLRRTRRDAIWRLKADAPSRARRYLGQDADPALQRRDAIRIAIQRRYAKVPEPLVPGLSISGGGRI